MLRRVALAAFIALLLAQPAAAWTPFATGLDNTVEPATLRTRAGAELIAWTDTKGSLYVFHNGLEDTVIKKVTFVGKPALVQQPNGAIQLYVPMQGNGFDGVVRLTSVDDGASWTGPIATKSRDLADVGSAAVRPDGTPLFTQSGTGFVNVFQGLNGETVTNVFPGVCCGYAESIAVDSTNVARVAFWSNAQTQQDRFVVQQLGGALTTFGVETIPRDDRVPLVSYGTNTYLLWSDGYPTATSLLLQRVGGGAVQLDKNFTGGDPHMALALEPDGKLWALWTKGGLARAARSRTIGVTFGAVVTIRLPVGATAYQLEAVGKLGSVDALVNTGSELAAQTFLPGLTVTATKKKLVTVRDDGFPVKGATLTVAGNTFHTDAKGHANLATVKKHTLVSVTATGYTPTKFRLP